MRQQFISKRRGEPKIFLFYPVQYLQANSVISKSRKEKGNKTAL